MAARKKKLSPKTPTLQADAPRGTVLGVLIGLCALILLLHLWIGNPFARHLIDLDDKTYVGALEGMSVGTYLSTRLWEPNTLSFPVRDLSFILDFYASSAAGVKTFILSSTLLLCAYIFLSWSLFSRFVPPHIALILTTILALHPINVEVVQWVISRKHLLAGVFAMLAVILTVDARGGKNEPSGGVFLKLFLLYALSLLSHPPALLLPAWIVYMLWPRCRKAPLKIQLFIISTFTFAVWWTSFQSSQNKDYSVTNSTESELLLMKISNGVLGLGRAAWQAIAPFQQAVYFHEDQPQNLLGLILCAGALALFVRHIRKHGVDDGARMMIVGAILFLPQLAFTCTRKDFTMADRFLFMPLPYLFLGALLCIRPREWWASLGISHRSQAIFGAIALGLIFTVISSQAIYVWRSELPLFKHCVDQTSSDRCWWHYSRELFKAGCPLVMDESERMTKELAAKSKRPGTLYPPDGALILSTCEASAYNISKAEQMQQIDSLQALGATPESLVFARNLVSIANKEIPAAYHRIIENFLKTNVDGRLFSVAILGMIEGQLRALCETPSPPGINCFEILSTFRAKYAKNDISTKAVGSGYNNTVQALTSQQR